MLQITNENFDEEILKSDKGVLLEFYSDSCVPCKRMSPVIAEIEEEYTNIKVAKLNINFAAETAQKYSVLSSPTFLFFKDSKEVKRIKGVVSKDELEDAIEEVLL